MTQQFSAPYSHPQGHPGYDPGYGGYSTSTQSDTPATHAKATQREKVRKAALWVTGSLLLSALILFGLARYQSSNELTTLTADLQAAHEQLAAAQASAAESASCRDATQELVEWWNAPEVEEGSLSPVITKIVQECTA